MGGLVIGSFPSIFDKEATSKKLVPSLLVFIMIAYLDWTDDDTWWFMGATVTSHWIFKEDYPNKVVDAAFKAMKDLARECCSSAYYNLCRCANSLFKDAPNQSPPSSTKSPRRA